MADNDSMNAPMDTDKVNAQNAAPGVAAQEQGIANSGAPVPPQPIQGEEMPEVDAFSISGGSDGTQKKDDAASGQIEGVDLPPIQQQTAPVQQPPVQQPPVQQVPAQQEQVVPQAAPQAVQQPEAIPAQTTQETIPDQTYQQPAAPIQMPTPETQPVYNNVPQESMPADAFLNEPQNTPKSRSNVFVILIIIVGFLLLVGGSAYYLFVYMPSKNAATIKPKETPIVQPVPEETEDTTNEESEEVDEAENTEEEVTEESAGVPPEISEDEALQKLEHAEDEVDLNELKDTLEEIDFEGFDTELQESEF